MQWVATALVLSAMAPATAFGQAPPEGAPAPAVADPAPPGPRVPDAGVPPAEPSAATAPAPALAAGSREAELESRVRQLEAMVNQLSTRIQAMPATAPAAVPATALKPASRSTTGGALAPGQSVTAAPSPSDDYNMPAPNRKDRLQGTFGPGFMLKTDDDEYVLQFHNLTQLDFRGYQQGGQSPVHDTFAIPRQWYMFSGRISKPFEYFVSFQQGFDVLAPLDIFINVDYDERFQVRAGRFKTPFTYEFFHEPIQGLVNPERSLFFHNFALNRSVGAQVWGQLLQRRLDYAVGAFNSSRNGFLDTSDGKDFLAYVGYRPFMLEKDAFLQFFEIGGSVDLGTSQLNPPSPLTLRTQVPTTGSNVLGVPFLGFNNNVREAGGHTLWDLHAALYRNQLSLIAEWQSGFQDYALTSAIAQRTALPIQSFYVKGGYFLTGETVTNRNIVRPLHPLNLGAGEFGLGALELAGRYNYLEVGNQVFTNGLADQNLWSRSLYTTDLGFNWYPTQYTKIMFQWEHAVFGTPVLYAPGKEQLTSDSFWLRFQLFF